jgi:peptidyl-prolyl cis-trans isomerase B (cyclophilin B)
MIVLETNFGVIKIKLDEENTPITAKNFLAYVESGFYNNTVFHRVMDGFMIQGGGFESGMIQKTVGEPITNEADKGGSNKRGTLAMARTSDPESATAQFFINVKDNTFLDFKSKTADGWGYCVFAEVVEGMDTVDKIKVLKTTAKSGHHDVPEEDVIIETARIETAVDA